MNKEDFEKLIRAIPTLEEDQRSALLSRITVADKLDLNKSTSKIDPLLEHVYDAMSVVMETRGHRLPSFTAFTKLDVFKTYKKQMELIRPFFDTLFKTEKRITKVRRIAMFGSFFTLLLEEVAPSPLTLKTLIQNLHLLPSTIESAFPGYLEEGMLLWALELPIEIGV